MSYMLMLICVILLWSQDQQYDIAHINGGVTGRMGESGPLTFLKDGS